MSLKKAKVLEGPSTQETTTVTGTAPLDPISENGEVPPSSTPQPTEVHRPSAAIQQPQREPGDEAEYPPAPNPRSWHENFQVGVKFRTNRETLKAELVFGEKPSQPVIDYIKEQGFRWNGKEKLWERPISFKTAAQDRLIAMRTYSGAVGMIQKERGLEPQPELEAF
jgi:hypothetical protein